MSDESTAFLRLDRLHWPVTSLGPGRRAGVWVRGCSLGCPGCISRSLWPRSGGREVPAESLADEIVRIEGLDGVTVTGGEPLEQHDGLIAFCRRLKSRRPWLDVLVYTGWRLEELQRRFPGGELLEVIDGLVDGPFVEAEHDDSGWRGSRNQRYFAVSGGRAQERLDGFVPGPWSVAIEPDGTLFMTGIPRPGELARLYAELRRAGIVVREG